MAFKMTRLFTEDLGSLRRRVFGLYCLLLLFNAGSWFWAVMVFHGRPLLLGTPFLAYSLGLRHAVDADHIAAIDNVMREMMHAGKTHMHLLPAVRHLMVGSGICDGGA